MVPDSLLRPPPCSLGHDTYRASRIAAVALIVIEVEIFSRSMPSNRRIHVVDGVDGHADLADLAHDSRIIGIESDLRRQIEGDRSGRWFPGSSRYL